MLCADPLFAVFFCYCAWRFTGERVKERSDQDSKWNIVRSKSQFGNEAQAMLLCYQSWQCGQVTDSAALDDKTIRKAALRKGPKRDLANEQPSLLMLMGISVLSSGLIAACHPVFSGAGGLPCDWSSRV